MKKCKKRFKRGPSILKFQNELILNEVNKIFIGLCDVQNQCVCGCFRTIKSLQSLLLQKYLCSKQRWIGLLCVRRNRILELSAFSEMILGMDSTNEFNSLDLNLVKSDTLRQQWLTDRCKMDLVERAIYTFCLYNNVAYWQGIHDVAAALSHLEPTPTVGELAVLLEYLIKNYAPLLFSNTTSEVTAKANELSLKWRLLFKYFFPKASHDYDEFCESSFSIGWFMTLGFYRFGCAYICLAYTFLLIISRHDCISSFMFRELGYLAARGYINYLIGQNVPVDFNNSVIFSNFSNSSLIVNTLVNSNKIVLESEEFINISKNLYDTFNGRDFELSEFPLLYIFKAANILQNSAPSVHKIDAQKEFVEITEPDLFSKSNRFRSLESNLKGEEESFMPKYRSKKRFSLSRRRKIKDACFVHRNAECKISDLVNSEMIYSYILSLKRYGCLRMYGSTGRSYRVWDENFVYGNMLNQNILYNILDLRSAYLCSGMSLDKIFGTSKTTFLKSVNAHQVFESCLLDTNFTLWVVLTDEGYEAENDNNAVVSLNRGLEAMESLSRNSITCVTMFRGGYKGILKSLNLPVPLPPSILSRLSVRRILPWNAASASESTSSNNLTSIAASIGTTAMGIEHRILKGISDMSIFSRFRHSQLPQITRGNEDLESMSLIRGDYERLSYADYSVNKMAYSIKLSSKTNIDVSIRSNGRIKTNGIILHPSQYKNAASDPNVSILISLSTLFTVNCVDGFLDVECRSYGVGKLNAEVADIFKQKTDEILSNFSIVICPFVTKLSDASVRPFTIITNVAGVCSKVRLNGIARKWNVFIIRRHNLTRHLLKCITIVPQKQVNSQKSELDLYDNGTNNEKSDTDYISLRFSNMGITKRISGTKNGLNGNQGSVWSSNFVVNQISAANGAIVNKMNLERNIYRLNDQRMIKVFSRTHEPRSHESSSRSTVSNVDMRFLVKTQSKNKHVPIYYNNNVFVSRSVLNKRQNSNI